jgi:hypothetical protein
VQKHVLFLHPVQPEWTQVGTVELELRRSLSIVSGLVFWLQRRQVGEPLRFVNVVECELERGYIFLTCKSYHVVLL